MKNTSRSIFIGENELRVPTQPPSGDFVYLFGQIFYKIENYDAMPPFFMSLASSSNHWFFIASPGGLSAGRENAAASLFPYYTVDKIIENSENTGPKTILLVQQNGRTFLWEPFSKRNLGIYSNQCNLYKNISGTCLFFEEINKTLGLTFRYSWQMGDTFGFIKSTWIINDRANPCQIEVLDGLQNIVPANVPEMMQNNSSVLVDAYKRNELDPSTGMGIFTINSIPTDLAEPSESLLASIAWQLGLHAKAYLLSDSQVDSFRSGQALTTENEIRGSRGAYYVNSVFTLAPGAEHSWMIAADVKQDATSVVHLQNLLKGDPSELYKLIQNDLDSNKRNLETIVACADGQQLSADKLITANHFANVMFNVMRGGYFPDQYIVRKADFLGYLNLHEPSALAERRSFLIGLPEKVSITNLRRLADQTQSTDLLRLINSYLPLSFSRRHGDPSRPWNRFSINTRKEDGSLQLDYQGNWRDIFQNWEALAYSYPEYVENMISVFLNATTADGYNPYRITYHGIDWEVPDLDNPWANIGYWSDHQIIYLEKLFEISSKFHPGYLDKFLDCPVFSYANVPYRIKPYEELIKDPFETILFDWDLEKKIEKDVAAKGASGKLIQTRAGQVLHATMTEKLLTLLLAKLVNFVPEGGIWMNTQRPEWNDANNALVGKGLSVVTLSYLRRFLVNAIHLFKTSKSQTFRVHVEVKAFYNRVLRVLEENEQKLEVGFSDITRRRLMDELGQAGSDYRWKIYDNHFSGEIDQVTRKELVNFLDLALRYFEHTLKMNRRDDDLFHTYNILHLGPGVARIEHLYGMLEGQVAILSSGVLTGEDSLSLLRNLRNGPLFREDQYSYILYPDRILKGFLERNTLDHELVKQIPLINELMKDGNKDLIIRDELGEYHFAGAIHNIKDVRYQLEKLRVNPRFSDFIVNDKQLVEELFEKTFHHSQYTGRSGTFFAYEGLGSIYWHMVSKLLLAVQETILRTRHETTVAKLIECYKDIRAGQCISKTPAEYGAFPMDPYSHTPEGQGAKQPGMSGLVKEEILVRQAELGLVIAEGRLGFDPILMNPEEFLESPTFYSYIDVNMRSQQLALPAGSLVFSTCQVPVIVISSTKELIQIHYEDGHTKEMISLWLDADDSQHIFQRDGYIHHLEVYLPTCKL